MRLIYFIVAFGALATSCGSKTLDCGPRTVSVTGTLETDILGSWDGGVASIDEHSLTFSNPDGS